MSIMDPTRDKGENEDEKSALAINESLAMGTVSMNTTSTASPFQQHPPPSPLSGCYLLVVLPEPHTAQHKDLIINRLAKGFLSWDKDSCHVDLTKELQALVTQSPEGEEARNGERLIQYATENLVTEILIHPQTNTLLQCIRNLLASFTKHRHIIHAGYTFSENGSWILQDGTFSFADFLDAFNEHDVQRVLRAYENSVTVDINCAAIGDWSEQRLSKEPCTRSCRIRLNPDDVLTAGMPAITGFTSYISQYLVSQELDELMEPSDVVGNIRFSHPTLYVFPGGQGDAALFGINGFNMLVDGGFARKSCFWDFTRHLDRLDAVLFTRLNNSNVGGMSSVLKKKREVNVYPQIGHFFCNLVERKHSNSPDGDKDLDPLILSLIDIGQEMMVNLKHINLRPHTCYRDQEPINLYHKVGHGTLDMYVLSPTEDCREVREFLAKWNSSDAKLFAGSNKKDANNMIFPIQNLISICALLVWQPANPDDTITRILFPGSAPQHKIFEGLQRLKNLEFLNHPTCTAKSMSPSASLVTLKEKSMKQKLSSSEREIKRVIETKRQKREIVDVKKADNQQQQQPKPQQQQPAMIKTKKMSALENKKVDDGKDYPKVITETKKSEKIVKEPKKELKKETKDTSKVDKEIDSKKSDVTKSKTDGERVALPKPTKSKSERKKKETKEITKVPLKTPKSEYKSDNLADQTIKASTPKKTFNGLTTKGEIAKVSASKTTHKPAAKPTPAPAKSAKDANNRKVLEQKNIEKMSSSGSINATMKPLSKSKPTQPPVQNEKKAVVRRAKPITSPSKVRSSGSPVKSMKSAPVPIKSEKDAVIKKIKSEKGTAESSAVSTPSAIETDATKFVDKCLTERSEDMSLDSIESKVLADLKEERQVVEEIEAVLQKAERTGGVIMSNEFEGEDETTEANYKKEEDMTEDDVTADIDDLPRKEVTSRKPSQEFTEEDEYLIIEKEEVYTESSVQSGEAEQKHILDAAQSEKDGFAQQSLKKREEMNYKVTVQDAPEKVDEEEGNVEEDEEEEEEDEDEEVELEVEIDEEDIEDEEKVNIEEIEEEDEEDEVIELKDDDGVEKDVEKGIGEEQEKTDEPASAVTMPEKPLKEMIKDESVVEKAEYKEPVQQNIQETPAISTGISQKTEDKDDSGKKGEDVTKEVSSLTPEKLDSSEKKTTDTDTKPELDSKDPHPREKFEESQERISTIESGATTTAPTLPEDEKVPIESIKTHTVEKQVMGDLKRSEIVTKAEIIPLNTGGTEVKTDAKVFVARQTVQAVPRDIVKTPDEVADLPVHEEVDPKLYEMDEFNKSKEEKLVQPKDSKEQKGVFGFFGKVADKFEKGMDKLTGKSRRDSEKDIDEKSSSKSASPKEAPDTISAIPIMEDKKELDDVKHVIEDKLPSPVPQAEVKEPLAKHEIGACEDVEEVEALLEEASKKFKTVKDSLRDSLESLEDRIIEEDLEIIETAQVNETDEVKGTLDEVVEKLSEIESVPPRDDELEQDDLEKDTQMSIFKDVKEAMRDVGEVLAGTAGIVIENKPKDVVEIVKKVAEVLKSDDFLIEETLFVDKATEDKIDDTKPVDDSHVVDKSLDIVITDKECTEPPCVKHTLDRESADVHTLDKDDTAEKAEVRQICLDLMKDDEVETRDVSHVVSSDELDVIKNGTEHVCEKMDIHQAHDGITDLHTETPEINFERKSSAATAELVVLSPDSLPPSPKLPVDKLHDKADVEDIVEFDEAKVPVIVVDMVKQTKDIHEIMEQLIIVKKIFVTIQILEYIIKIKHISRQIIMEVIEQIMVENKITSADDIMEMEDDELTGMEESEIEQYIDEQYVKKNKIVTRAILDDISKETSSPIWLVIQIIRVIIVKKGIKEDSILHVSEEELQQLLKLKDKETDSVLIEHIDDSGKKESAPESLSPIEELESELENEFMCEYVNKGKKITRVFIYEIHVRYHIATSVIIAMIEQMIVKHKLLKHDVVDISEASWNELRLDVGIEVEDELEHDVADSKLVAEVIDFPSEDVHESTKAVEPKTTVSERVVSDDFEAVEQEYKLDVARRESKIRTEVEEAMEDDINDAVEAEEKVIASSLKEVATESQVGKHPKESSKVMEEIATKPEESDKSLKSSQADDESDSEKSQQLISSEMIKHDDDGTKLEKDEKVTTVRRMVVTATSEDGGEETELCPGESITLVSDKVSDVPSPVDSLISKEVTGGSSVHSRASTPGIESFSDKSSPELERKSQILDAAQVEDDTLMKIITTSTGKDDSSLPSTEIDLGSVETQKILKEPTDSVSISPTVDEKIVTEKLSKDEIEKTPEEKRLSISEVASKKPGQEIEVDAGIDRSISPVSPSSQHEKVLHKEKSSPIKGETISVEGSIEAHVEKAETDQPRTPLEEATEIKHEEKRLSLSHEITPTSSPSHDILDIKKENLTRTPSPTERIEEIATVKTPEEIESKDEELKKDESSVEKLTDVPKGDAMTSPVGSTTSQPESHAGKASSDDEKIPSPVVSKIEATSQDLIDKMTTITTIDDPKSSVPSSVAQVTSLDESIIVESVKSPSPTPDLANITLSITEKAEIDDKISEKKSTSPKTEQDKLLSQLPERQLTSSNESIADENEKSLNVSLELSNQTFIELDSTQVKEKEVIEKSITPTMDHKSTASSPGRHSPLHVDEVTKEKESSPVAHSHSHVDEMVKEKELSPVDHSPSHVGELIKEKELSPVAHLPSQVGELIKEKELSPVAHLPSQVGELIKEKELSPVDHSPSHVGELIKEKELSPVAHLPSQVDEVIKERELSPGAHSPSHVGELIKEKESSPVDHSPSQVDEVITEKESSPVTHSPLHVDEMVKEKELSPVAHSPSQVDEVIKEKESSPVAHSPSQVDEVIKEKEISPVAHPPSHIDEMIKEKDPSPIQSHELSDSIPIKTEIGMVDDKTSVKSVSPIEEKSKLVEPSSGPQPHTPESDIAAKQDKPSSLTDDSSDHTEKMDGDTKMTDKIIKEKSMSPISDHIERVTLSDLDTTHHEKSTEGKPDKSLSPASEKADRDEIVEQSIDEKSIHQQEDEFKPTIPVLTPQSVSPKEQIISDSDKLPSLPHDLDISVPYGAKDKKIDEAVHEKQSPGKDELITAPSKTPSPSHIDHVIEQDPAKNLISGSTSPIASKDITEVKEKLADEESTSSDVDHVVSSTPIDVTKLPSQPEDVDEKKKSPLSPQSLTGSAPAGAKIEDKLIEQQSKSPIEEQIKSTESSGIALSIQPDTISTEKVELLSLSDGSGGKSPSKLDDTMKIADDIKQSPSSVEKPIHSEEILTEMKEKSPLHEESILSEGDRSEKTPSEIGDMQVEKDVIDQTSISPTKDQIESIVSSSRTPSLTHEKDVATEKSKSPSSPHDMSEVMSKVIDDVETIEKDVRKDSIKPTLDELTPVVSSPSKQSPDSEKKIAEARKSPTISEDSFEATPIKAGDISTDKESMNLITTATICEGKLTPPRSGTQSPDHKSDTSEKHDSIHSLHDSDKTSPVEAVDVEREKKVGIETSVSPIADSHESIVSPSKTNLSISKENIGDETHAMLDTTHHSPSPARSEESITELHKDMIIKDSISPSKSPAESIAHSAKQSPSHEDIKVGEKLHETTHDIEKDDSLKDDKDTIVDSSITHAVDQVESIKISPTISLHSEGDSVTKKADSPSPIYEMTHLATGATEKIGTDLSEKKSDLTPDQSKSIEPATILSSPGKGTVEDKSPSHSDDSHITSSIISDSMAIELETIQEKSSTSPEDRVKSDVQSSPGRSPSRKESIMSEISESVERTHIVPAFGSKTEDADTDGVIIHGKTISPTADKVDSVAAITATPLPSLGDLSKSQDSLESLAPDSGSPSLDEHHDMIMKLADKTSMEPMDQSKPDVLLITTQSTTHIEGVSTGKDESATMSRDLSPTIPSETDSGKVKEMIDDKLPSLGSDRDKLSESLTSQLSSHDKDLIEKKEQLPSSTQQLISPKPLEKTDLEPLQKVIDATSSDKIDGKSLLSSTSPSSPSHEDGETSPKEKLLSPIGVTSDQAEHVTEKKDLEDLNISSKASNDDPHSVISSAAISPDRKAGSRASPEVHSPDSKIVISSDSLESIIHPISTVAGTKDTIGEKTDRIDDVKASTVPQVTSSIKEYSKIDDDKDDGLHTGTKMDLQLTDESIHKEFPSLSSGNIQLSSSMESESLKKSSPVSVTGGTTGIDESSLGSPKISPLSKEDHKINVDIEKVSEKDIAASPVGILRDSEVKSVDESVTHLISTTKESKSTDPSLNLSSKEVESHEEETLIQSSKPIHDESMHGFMESATVTATDAKDTEAKFVSDTKPEISDSGSVKEKVESLSTLSTSAESDSVAHTGKLQQVKVVETGDRSRSQSLLGTDDKISLSRSTVASLSEDEDEMKSSVSSKVISQYGEKPSRIHDEHLEYDEKSVESTDHHDITPSKRTDVEQFIISEYVSTKQRIRDSGLQEIIDVFHIPKSTLIEIIHEICIKKNIDKKSLLDRDDDDDNLESDPTATREDVILSRISSAKRLQIENYITEMYIKPRKKMSLKIITEVTTAEKVSQDVIYVIIKYLVTREKIAMESLVEDELWTRIQETVEGKRDEDYHHSDSYYVEDSEPTSEQQRREIESYVMENYIEKGERISLRVLNDIEKVMLIRRWILLEIIVEMIRKMKIPLQTVCDDDVYSEISCKEQTSEHELSGYSTPEVRRYDDKFESQFHKAFVGGMTEIRTTHITTLSGKSTPDVGTRVDTPESLSELPITTETAPTFGSSDIKLISGTVTSTSAQEQSPEHETIIQVKSIKRTIIEDDDSTGEKDGTDIVRIIQSSYPDEQHSTYETRTMKAPRKDLRESLTSGDKSRSSTPDRTRTGTPEGFRTGAIMKTTITTTRTMSEEGDIITTTEEVTETTNEKGETTVSTKKLDVSVEDRVPIVAELSSIESMIASAAQQSMISGLDSTTLQSDPDSISHVKVIQLSTSKDGKQFVTDVQKIGSQSSASSQEYDYVISEKPVEFSTADMSSSFYGQLPDVPPSRITETTMIFSDDGKTDDFTFKKMTSDSRVDVMSTSQHQDVSNLGGIEVEKYFSMHKDDDDEDSQRDSGSSTSKDPLHEWGTPLKLPPPERPEKFNLRNVAIVRTVDISPDSLDFDVIHDWGEPMRLPSPTQIADDNIMANKITSAAVKKEVKQPKKVISENLKNKKSSESPIRGDKKSRESKNKVQPVYLDLTYVPHHGNSYYASLEFFKRVRARYYVFSGTEPSREVYDALLHAKKTWENKSLEVTIIPTYDTDTLGYWVADNEEALAANHIDLSPSASRCTINLQDHETSCSAYRLEF